MPYLPSPTPPETISTGFWHRPSLPDAIAAGRQALPLVAVWILVFVGADYLTSSHSYRVRIHLPGEERLPFVPAAVVVYQSIHALFVMAPFILGRNQLRRMGTTLLIVILIAGVGFLVVPSELGFAPSPQGGAWEEAVRVTREWALPHNLVPSLHVALSVVCVAIYAPRAGRLGKILLWGWASAIALSTLLLHQHHLLDVVTGWALGLAAVRFVHARRGGAGANETIVTRHGPGANLVRARPE